LVAPTILETLQTLYFRGIVFSGQLHGQLCGKIAPINYMQFVSSTVIIIA